MRNLLRKSLVLALTFSLVVLSGCMTKSEPTKEPKEMIKDAMQGVQDATSYGYKLDMDVAMSGPEGKTPQEVKFKGGVSGVMYPVDIKNPKFTAAVDGSLQMDSEPATSLKGEVRMLNKVLYAELLNLPLSEQDLPKELADTFLNKWWSYPLTDQMIAEMNVAFTPSDEKEAQRIREIYEQVNFLNPEYVGSESVDGVDTYKYKVNFDSAKFLEFMEKVSQEKGAPMSATDKEDLQKTLGVATISGEVYVAAVEKPYLAKFTGSVKIDSKEDGVKGLIKFALSLSDLNKAADVKIPEGAQPFSPLMLGALGILGAPQGEIEPSTLEAVPTDNLGEVTKVPVK